jgi:hypothetical protein
VGMVGATTATNAATTGGGMIDAARIETERA